MTSGARNLLILGCSAIAITAITTGLSLFIYRQTGDIYLDRSRPGFLPDMMEELSREVAVLFEQLADSSLLDSDVKVARFLCRRVEREHCVRRGAKVLVELSQELISRILGLSRWSVNQALGRLRAEGWVDTGYGAVRITDYPALQTFAGMDRQG